MLNKQNVKCNGLVYNGVYYSNWEDYHKSKSMKIQGSGDLEDLVRILKNNTQ
jgi:hypothetical protein